MVTGNTCKGGAGGHAEYLAHRESGLKIDGQAGSDSCFAFIVAVEYIAVGGGSCTNAELLGKELLGGHKGQREAEDSNQFFHNRDSLKDSNGFFYLFFPAFRNHRGQERKHLEHAGLGFGDASGAHVE